MAGITFGTTFQQWIRNVFKTASGVLYFSEIIKGISGDMVFACTPSTKTVAHGSMNTTTVSCVVYLRDAAGNNHQWYNGPVTLAIATTSVGGTPAISPIAGSQNMVDGQLVVNITGTGTWLAADTITLTVSKSTVPICSALANATCVVTMS
jgi:hypothetical protein